jgi:hypothetical protein
MRVAFAFIIIAIVAIACTLAACGSSGRPGTGPTQDGGASQDAYADVWGDGGWTQCTSPDHLAVCGGPDHCSATSAACTLCGRCLLNEPGCTSQDPLNACGNDGLLAALGGTSPQGCPACPDGMICVVWDQQDIKYNGFTCSPFDLGVLFAKNGAADRVRYADMGLWDGGALPSPPATCPTVPGLEMCGGACGDCPDGGGEFCTGRSPLHPYGFCVPKDPGVGCTASKDECGIGGVVGPEAGVGCFSYTVQPDAQAVANQMGICLPTALCQAAAAGLPGGGTCSL